MIGHHYRRIGTDGRHQLFDSTADTRSNWDATIQHGSPPMALLTKTIEELTAGSGLRIGRLTLDILGAIPVTQVRVHAWVDRPGTRISLVVAEMVAARPDGSWRTVARVSAWLLAPSDTGEVATDRHPPLIEGEMADTPHGWVGVRTVRRNVSIRDRMCVSLSV